ncbi:MAG: DUF1573 domain-containing protein [Rikenellaceae bacterium]
MFRIKATTLIIGALCAIVPIAAQTLDFDHSEYDFGTIQESAGSVSHEFKFSNGGDKALVIYNTRSSCGCTTIAYSEQPIIAGDSSSVVVTYDPKGRPGTFMRDIYIYSTASKAPTVVRITGAVETKELTIEQRYPHVVADVARISATHLSVGSIARGWMSSASLEVLNVSADTLRVELRSRTHRDYLDVGFATQLEPREGAVMEVGYLIEEGQEAAKGEDGHVGDTLDLFINGKQSGTWLRVSGILTK